MIHSLRRLRFELGDLTLAQFSELTAVDSGILSRIENRKRKTVDLSTLRSLTAGLSISLDQAAALCDSSLSDSDFSQLVSAARAALAGRFRGGNGDEAETAERTSLGSSTGSAVDDSRRTEVSAGHREQS